MNSRPLILTMFASEEYQLLLSKVNADFIIYNCLGAQKITCKLPDNHIVVRDITPNIRPDIFLSQNKLYHYKILRELANKHRKPLVSVYTNIPQKNDLMMTRGFFSEANVFMSSDHAASWQSDRPTFIIPPCPVSEVGNKKPELYINKSSDFNSVYKILEAMARGACVISPANFEINNIITQSYDGFLYNSRDPNGEKNLLAKIVKNEELVIEVGKNAQKTIREKFSIGNFVNNWNNLISEKMNENTNK